MTKKNFNEELIVWFNQMLDQTVGDQPEKVEDYLFDLDEAKKDLVFIVYERLYKQFGKARMTAQFFGISSRTVRNYVQK